MFTSPPGTKETARMMIVAPAVDRCYGESTESYYQGEKG